MICSAIVVFNPDLSDLRAGLLALHGQVDRTVMVVNGAAPEDKTEIDEMAHEFGAHVIRNVVNLGIAAALNQAAAYASAQSAEYLLLLDQDSVVAPDLVSKLLRGLNETPRAAIACPLVVNSVSGHREGPLVRSTDGPFLAQTSGSMMPLAMFEDVGRFREDFFIDYVDYEFCLRIQRRGWRVCFRPDAELRHKPGNNEPTIWLGRKRFAVNASPDRHYYMVRNMTWLTIRYVLTEPTTIAALLVILVRTRIKSLLLERGRAAKVFAWFDGLADGLSGRMGPRRWP